MPLGAKIKSFYKVTLGYNLFDFDEFSRNLNVY